MRILILVSIFLSACSVFRDEPTAKNPPPVSTAPPESLRKRVIVLPFLDSNIHRPEKVRNAARKELVRQLAATKEYVLIKPTDLPYDVQNFINAGQYDLVAMTDMAKSLDIVAIIEGKILEVKARRVGDAVGLWRNIKAEVSAKVRLRAIGVRNNRILMDEERSATVISEVRKFTTSSPRNLELAVDPELITKAVRKAFRGSFVALHQSTNKILWAGRIALVKGDRIYINAGRVTGIQIGDVLRVAAPGEEVYDPETGIFVGLAPGRTKGTIEVVNYFGQDGAVAVIHSGNGFIENDRVELY